jgi:hypothetical protein
MDPQIAGPAQRIRDAGTQVDRIQGPDGEELLPRSAEVPGEVGAGIHRCTDLGVERLLHFFT